MFFTFGELTLSERDFSRLLLPENIPIYLQLSYDEHTLFEDYQSRRP